MTTATQAAELLDHPAEEHEFVLTYACRCGRTTNSIMWGDVRPVGSEPAPLTRNSDAAEVERALRDIIREFDYWVGPPRPAIDGGTVRIHKFNEVQPEMERALDRGRAALAATAEGSEGKE